RWEQRRELPISACPVPAGALRTARTHVAGAGAPAPRGAAGGWVWRPGGGGRPPAPPPPRAPGGGGARGPPSVSGGGESPAPACLSGSDRALHQGARGPDGVARDRDAYRARLAPHAGRSAPGDQGLCRPRGRTDASAGLWAVSNRPGEP